MDPKAVHDELLRQFQGLIGNAGADAVANMLESASRPAQRTIAAVMSLVTLVIVSMGMFSALQDALNLVWRTSEKAGTALWGAIQSKFLSFILVHRHGVSPAGHPHRERLVGGLEQIHWSLDVTLPCYPSNLDHSKCLVQNPG